MKKTKRILTAVLAAAVAAVSCSSMISASAASGKYYAYRYYFDVSANANIDAYNANISHSSSSVIYAGSAKGNLGGTFSVSDVSVTTSRRITYVNYESSSPSSNSGYLGFVTFKTLTTSTPTVTVTLVSGDNIANSVSVNKILLGDVNFDGKVDNTDYELLKKCAVGSVSFSNTQFRAGDIDGNNEINTRDVINLLQYIEGTNDSVLG